MTVCYNTDHFYDLDGVLYPQPWMQYRHVGTVEAAGKYSDFAVTVTPGGGFNIAGLFGGLLSTLSGLFGGLFGGLIPDPAATPANGNKNDLLHTVTLAWTNDSPIDQWCYGLISRGGARVTLQARSRGYLVVSSGYAKGAAAGPLEVSSVMGCGADLARAGVLAVGTTFCVLEQRQNSLTIPLAPERVGWQRLAPGETMTAKVELRFVSEMWETSMIDGGSSEVESSIDTGATRLDLYAVPVLE